MKQNIFRKTFTSFIISLSIIISFSGIIYGDENNRDDFIIGKLEFIGQSGREGIIVMNSSEKAYLLNKGTLVQIKRVNGPVVLKIIDSDGKYLRFSINSETAAAMQYGEDVYYTDSLNSGIKYRDAKRILAELIELYENFILKIESTEDTRIISATVKNFSLELDKLIPEMKRINSKYPELVKFNVSPPPELQNESAKLEVLEPRLRDAFYKIKMYYSDENVKKASDDLQKVLTKMNTGR